MMIVWVQLFFLLILALGVLLTPVSDSKRRYVVLVGSFLNLVLSAKLFMRLPSDGTSLILFDGFSSDLFLSNCVVAIDFTSGLFVLLNAIILFIVIMGTWRLSVFNNKLHYIIILMASWLLNHVFLTASLTIFYVLYDVALLLGFMLTIVFLSEKNKIPFRVFLLPAVGSIFMLIVVASLSIGAYQQFGNFSLTLPHLLSLDFTSSSHLFSKNTIFWFLLFAIILKMQIVPFHSSLMKIQMNAAVSARLMFVPVLSLAGFYGIVRFVYPLFQDMLDQYRFIFVTCLLGGFIYSILLMMKQNKIIKQLSFFSLSAVCLSMMGIFIGNKASYGGSLFYICSYSLVIIGLWLLDYFLSRDSVSAESDKKSSERYGINRVLQASFLMLALAAIGLPTTSEFIGKIFIVKGALLYDMRVAIGLIVGLILSSICLLRSLKKVICIESESFALKLKAMHFWEIVAVVLVVTCVVTLGFFPNVLMRFVA